MNTNNTFECYPAYYEFHLLKNSKLFYAFEDPSEDLYEIAKNNHQGKEDFEYNKQDIKDLAEYLYDHMIYYMEDYISGLEGEESFRLPREIQENWDTPTKKDEKRILKVLTQALERHFL